jgi:hypothetical protein
MITGSLGQHKQDSPLLERLDWFLASPSWMVSYPGFSVKTLSRDISDHNPCTLIFQRQIFFRFENYWMLHDDFMQIMEHGWNLPNDHVDKEK